MIVRNEAARLEACLASAAPAVDEIVIVDTGSTDGTQALARSAGARVVEWAWRDDFAAARNQALAAARGSWVLMLDADERLAPDAAALIRTLTAAGGADGFNCQLVSRLPEDQPSPTITHSYCRLFRPLAGVAFEGRVHEQIAPSIIRAGGRIAASDITILHEGYADVSPTKLARNLRLLECALAERPNDAFVNFNLGLTLVSAGQWTTACAAFERALAITDAPLNAPLRAIAWMKLGEARMRDGDWHAAGEAAAAALALEPELALARYALGRSLFEQGAIDAAGAVFDELADAGADALGMTLHPRVVSVARALVMIRQRRLAEAAEVLEPVAADDPTGEASLHLGNVYLALGRLGEAADVYRAARAAGITDAQLERRLELCTRLAGIASAGLALGGPRA